MALIFTRRSDSVVRSVGLAIVLLVVITTGAVAYYFTPKYTRVGYAPEQPVPFSHQQHVGQIGLDCRYCHQAVTESPHSTVPTAQTCMNCHAAGVKAQSPLLAPIRASWPATSPPFAAKGPLVPWKRVHKVPDFAYFNHSIHVNRGVSCVSCHGKVNEMKVVFQHEPQSMSWCLDCHRDPAKHLVPGFLSGKIDLNEADALSEKQKKDRGQALIKQRNINPPENCQGCHR